MSDPSIPAPGSSSADSTGAAAPAANPPGSVILEMRDITKEFPGVKALSNVSMAVRRGEVHAICGENGAGKSTLMKVLSGVHPARHLRRRDPLRGPLRRVQQHPRQRARRHRHHPPGARAHPGDVDRREHLPRQRDGQERRHQLARHPRQGARAARPRRPRRGARHQDPRHRRRQAAARRDRQGALQGRQAAHPRRADRRAQRGRLPAPARPHRGPALQGRDLHHDQAQAQRDRADRRLHHHHPRRQVDRDAARQGGRRRREPDHPRHGRP